MVRSPVDICLGTSPIHAEKSRPLANAAPLPIAATIALEMIGPMPGTVITLRQPSSLLANVSISSVTGSIRSSSCRQSPARSATMRTIRGERTSVRLARMSGSAWRRKRSPCRTMMPRSRRKPRIWLITAVRSLTRRDRTRCSACRSSCSSVLAGTKRVVGRCTASATLWASRKSFLCPCRNGFAYVGGTCFTSWPSAASSRAT